MAISRHKETRSREFAILFRKYFVPEKMRSSLADVPGSNYYSPCQKNCYINILLCNIYPHCVANCYATTDKLFPHLIQFSLGFLSSSQYHINNTADSKSLNSLEHWICTTSMTIIQPGRNSNPVPLRFESDLDQMNHGGRPMSMQKFDALLLPFKCKQQ